MSTQADQDDDSTRRSANALQVVDHDAPIFTISVAAGLAGMHPQTLRTYDRLGLVQPRRARGRGRRYSRRDIARLRLIQSLSQDEGINLNGISRILALETAMEQLHAQLAEMAAELSDVRAQAASVARQQARVFTAEASGAVHLGRRAGVQRPLQLPMR